MRLDGHRCIRRWSLVFFFLEFLNFGTSNLLAQNQSMSAPPTLPDVPAWGTPGRAAPLRRYCRLVAAQKIQEMMGHPGRGNELSFHTSRCVRKMNQDRATTLEMVEYLEYFSHSPEYCEHQVQGYFQQYFHRNAHGRWLRSALRRSRPGDSELQNYVGICVREGSLAAETALLHSDEFRTGLEQSCRSRVQDAIVRIFRRQPMPAQGERPDEVDFHTNRCIEASIRGRGDIDEGMRSVSLYIFRSPEYARHRRENICAEWVADLMYAYLGVRENPSRDPDYPSFVSVCGGLNAGRGEFTDLRNYILGTPRYAQYRERPRRNDIAARENFRENTRENTGENPEIPR